MQISILNSKKKLDLAENIFNYKFNEPLIHQVVTAFLSAGRAGTHAQKNRSAVRGGGTKPWRQKGSGRARAGTIRSPIWRKGGVTFAAQTQSYAQKVNKKMYRGALCSIWSELFRLERVSVVEALEIENHKTKTLLKKLSDMEFTGKILIVTEALDENLYLAARNLPEVDVRDVVAIDPVSLVGADKVIITTAALKQVEEWLQ